MTENTIKAQENIGYFGPYGGQYVPETLISALKQLTAEFESAWADTDFRADFDRCLREIAGRTVRSTWELKIFAGRRLMSSA